MEPFLPIIPKYARWIMTVILSLISIILFCIFKSHARKKVMIAMILSTIGDFFMTDIFGIGDFSTFPGAAFFIAAHIVYATCFTSLVKQNGWKYKNIGFYTGLILMAISLIAITIIGFIVENPKPIMYVLVVIYSVIIGWNLVSNFSYSFSAKGLQLIFLPIAIIIFYVTDIWIFMNMLNYDPRYRDLVWYFYPLAQLLLIVFVEPFKLKQEKEYVYIKK